jgi:hypothetical protein
MDEASELTPEPKFDSRLLWPLRLAEEWPCYLDEVTRRPNGRFDDQAVDDALGRELGFASREPAARAHERGDRRSHRVHRLRSFFPTDPTATSRSRRRDEPTARVSMRSRPVAALVASLMLILLVTAASAGARPALSLAQAQAQANGRGRGTLPVGVHHTLPTDKSSALAGARSEARRVTARFLSALDQGKYEQACALLAQQFYRRHHIPDRKHCIAGFAAGMGGTAVKFRILAVHARADRAIVHVAVDGSPGTVQLVRETAGWKITGMRAD